LKYDFKTVIASGWSKRIIEDERLEKKFFSRELEQIEELEAKVAEVESELNEFLEEVEEWDEEDNGKKTSNSVIKFLKEQINDLESYENESATRESNKFQELLEKIDKKNKQLKQLKRNLKKKVEELRGKYGKDQLTKEPIKIKDGKVDEKRESLSEEEAKELILEKFYDVIAGRLEKYLNAEKKELVRIFEKLWDKYSVPLQVLEVERDEEVKRLNEFLNRLGYRSKVWR
jgi:type I restriction enzyme M protein